MSDLIVMGRTQSILLNNINRVIPGGSFSLAGMVATPNGFYTVFKHADKAYREAYARKMGSLPNTFYGGYLVE